VRPESVTYPTLTWEPAAEARDGPLQAHALVVLLEEGERNASQELTSPYVPVLTDLAAAHDQRGDLERACGLLHRLFRSSTESGSREGGTGVAVRRRPLDRWTDTAARRLDDRLP